MKKQLRAKRTRSIFNRARAHRANTPRKSTRQYMLAEIYRQIDAAAKNAENSVTIYSWGMNDQARVILGKMPPILRNQGYQAEEILRTTLEGDITDKIEISW